MRGDLREPDEGGGDKQHAHRRHLLEADPRDQLRRDPGRQDDRDRQRQVGEPGLDRAVPEHLLHVQRDEEEHREQRSSHEQADDVRSPERPQPEDAEGHQRTAGAELDRDEPGDERDRGDQEPDRPRGAPAGAVCVEQRVDEQRQAGGDAHPDGEVEVPPRGVRPALGNQRGRDRRGDEPDRDVDPQHPLPAQSVRERAAEQHTRGAAAPGHGTPHAQRLVALGAVTEGGRHDRQRGGGEDRRPDALHGSRGDELAGVLGQAASQRRQREQHEARHEDDSPSQQVRHAPAQEQEATECEHVGVHNPRQVALGELQSAADRRKRDVHDRGVEHDHELRDAEERQRDPTAVLSGDSVCHRDSSLSVGGRSIIRNLKSGSA